MDDHPLFTDAFRELLSNTGKYTVVGTAHCGRSGVDMCAEKEPDIALVDMLLPDVSGPELLAAIDSVSPRTKKIVLSGLDSKEAICLALMAGADYYIVKTMRPGCFLETLDAACSGGMALSGPVANAIQWAVRAQRIQKRMSPAELEVLRLFGNDISVKEIATRARKAESTVYKYIERSKRRFSVSGDGELRRLLYRLGLAQKADTAK